MSLFNMGFVPEEWQLAAFLTSQFEEERSRYLEDDDYEYDDKDDDEDEVEVDDAYYRYSHVKYHDKGWQYDRCLKALQLQPFVKEFVSIFEKKISEITQFAEGLCKEYSLRDESNYESIRKLLDDDIKNLNRLGITIDGSDYKFSRIIHTNVNGEERILEAEAVYGDIFKIMDGQPIIINSHILSKNGYYEKKYYDTQPQKLEKERSKVNLKLHVYEKVGKLLRFLLKTDNYIYLKRRSEKLEHDYNESQLKKREMQSFLSLNKEQLDYIKSYLDHLNSLSKISEKIKVIFRMDKNIREKDKNTKYNYMFDYTLKALISSEKDREVVNKVYDYIIKMKSNDPKTMKEAYKLVKGQYPIRIKNKFFYELILDQFSKLKKKDLESEKVDNQLNHGEAKSLVKKL